MKSNNSNNFFAFILIVVLLFALQQPANTPESADNQPDYSDLVEPGVSFTGQNTFVSGTALSSEYVRIIKKTDGMREDMGTKSLASGTLATVPNQDYSFYFFFNTTAPSHQYYVDVMDYTGPSTEATESLVGYGCSIETSPIFVSRNVAGQVQSASANAQAMTTSTAYDMELNIKVHSDKCFGMPDAEGDNALCFIYNGNAISSIKANTDYISVKPQSVTLSTEAMSKSVSCWEFPKLSDLNDISIPYTVTTGTTEPTIAHNITVVAADFSFDLNTNTLEEIWGYEDEYGNALGAGKVALGTVYIS